MRLLRRLLLPVHFRETDQDITLAADSSEAFSVAMKLAQDAGAEITMTHVFPNTEDESFSDEGSFQAYHRVLDKCARAATDASVDCDWEFQFGNAAGEIVNFADASGFDLIVMGTRHDVGGGGRLVGTTAGQVMLGSAIPVMIARRNPNARRRVLIATNLSEACDGVLTTGLDIARARGASVHVVHAHPPVSEEEAAPVTCLRAKLELQIARVLNGESPPSELSTSVEYGLATNVIWHRASEEHADLVVMGMNGRRGGERVLHLNTAEVVLEDLPCSLLTVAC